MILTKSISNLNFYGLIVSVTFVLLVIFISIILSKKNFLTEEGSRKFIHIGVANWWFINMYMFDIVWFAIIPPILFIIINAVSYKFNLIDSMERKEQAQSLGTIYYPISLLIAVVLSYVFSNFYIPGIAILVLGYGDGMAAVIGSKFPSRKLFGDKTVYGSITMFFISLVITIVMFLIFSQYILVEIIILSLILAVVSTMIELISSKGTDNLSIPIGIMVLLFLVTSFVI